MTRCYLDLFSKQQPNNFKKVQKGGNVFSETTKESNRCIGNCWLGYIFSSPMEFYGSKSGITKTYFLITTFQGERKKKERLFGDRNEQRKTHSFV